MWYPLQPTVSGALWNLDPGKEHSLLLLLTVQILSFLSISFWKSGITSLDIVLRLLTNNSIWYFWHKQNNRNELHKKEIPGSLAPSNQISSTETLREDLLFLIYLYKNILVWQNFHNNKCKGICSIQLLSNNEAQLRVLHSRFQTWCLNSHL